VILLGRQMTNDKKNKKLSNKQFRNIILYCISNG